MAKKSTSFISVLGLIAQAIFAIFSFLLAKHKTKYDKNLKKENELNEAKNELSDICDNGSISDLIDITQKIKNIKK